MHVRLNLCWVQFRETKIVNFQFWFNCKAVHLISFEVGPSMDFRTMNPFVALLCVLLTSFSDAEQQKPSSFLSNYSSYKNICHKIGWEPKCRTEAEKGNMLYTYLLTVKTIASILFPETAAFLQNASKGNKCCLGGQITCYRPSSHFFFSEDNLFVDEEDVLNGKQIRVITL